MPQSRWVTSTRTAPRTCCGSKGTGSGLPEPPLIHVETPTCPSAPLNHLFWFDPQAKEVRQLVDGEGPCTVFRYVDDHLLENGMRASGLYLINLLRFEAGDFKPVGRKADLIWLPKANFVGYYLTTFTTWPLERPERLRVVGLRAGGAARRQFCSAEGLEERSGSRPDHRLPAASGRGSGQDRPHSLAMSRIFGPPLA